MIVGGEKVVFCVFLERIAECFDWVLRQFRESC